jgi:hypothetical protein
MIFISFPLSHNIDPTPIRRHFPLRVLHQMAVSPGFLRTSFDLEAGAGTSREPASAEHVFHGQGECTSSTARKLRHVTALYK